MKMLTAPHPTHTLKRECTRSMTLWFKFHMIDHRAWHDDPSSWEKRRVLFGKVLKKEAAQKSSQVRLVRGVPVRAMGRHKSPKGTGAHGVSVPKACTAFSGGGPRGLGGATSQGFVSVLSLLQ